MPFFLDCSVVIPWEPNSLPISIPARKIGRREAQYLLTFTNHASPVFISSYLIHTCMNGQVPAFRGILGLLLGFRLAHDDCACVCGYFVRAAGHCCFGPISRHKKRHPPAELSGSRTGCLYYERFRNDHQTGRVYSYVLDPDCLCPSFLEKPQSILSYVLFCLLEMTTGLHQLSHSSGLGAEYKMSLCPGHRRYSAVPASLHRPEAS